jgi:hypothetical protein
MRLGRPGTSPSRGSRRRRLAEAEPDRADYQRDLSISYERLGDLMVAVGNGAEAQEQRRAFARVALADVVAHHGRGATDAVTGRAMRTIGTVAAIVALALVVVDVRRRRSHAGRSVVPAGARPVPGDESCVGLGHVGLSWCEEIERPLTLKTPMGPR